MFCSLAVVAAVGASTACSSGAKTENGPVKSVAEFNDVDVMFVEMMLPHHEQAIVMSEMALDSVTGAGSDVIELATQIMAV